MKPWVQFFGLFRKEFRLQSVSRLSILNRLLIGPVISLATTGILYTGFFRLNPKLALAEMTGENYAPFILCGFLVHTYLNSGYYFFSSKVLGEWGARTLPLLWIAPCNRIVLLSSLYSMELLRCFLISLLGMAIIGFPKHSTLEILLGEAGLFLILITIGMCAGLIKSGVAMLNQGKAEMLDNCYLLFVFTSCPYIPKTLLPGMLQPFCDFNPAYHGSQLMRQIWHATPHWPEHLPVLVGGLLIFIAITLLAWQSYGRRVMENSF